jgi:hypothetical protein
VNTTPTWKWPLIQYTAVYHFKCWKIFILLPADCFSILLGLAKSFHCTNNHISDVMVSNLPSSVVDCGFEPWLGQSKDYKIGICCFCAKHIALGGVTCLSTDCCFSELHYKILTKHVGLVRSWPHHHLIEN